jgi:hypothetical protein
MMEKISKLSAYYLMLRYPPLAHYIYESLRSGDDSELLDFLFEIELDSPNTRYV